MAEKTFTRWTSHGAEEAIEELVDNEPYTDIFCDEEQKKWCDKDGDGCETCHAVKVTIKVEDA